MARTKEEIVQKFKEKFGDKYDYSLILSDDFKYTDYNQKLPIICHEKDYKGDEHGVFWMCYDKHYNRGQKCPKCARNSSVSFDEFKYRAEKKHNGFYSYKEETFKNMNSRMSIICPIHGEFKMTPHSHLAGEGCPKCAGKHKTTDEFRKELYSLKENYPYKLSDDSIYVRNDVKVKMICPKHGEFYATLGNLLMGKGCPLCGNETISKKLAMGIDEFKRRFYELNGDKYIIPSSVTYTNNRTKIEIVCPKHGSFFNTPDNLLLGEGCPVCGNGNHASKMEIEVNEFINSLGIKTRTSERSILAKKYEIDIYVPDFNLGIECDGLFWHNELHKEKNYHLNKTIECEEKGLRLIHIFEDEWIYKKDIIKSMLTNIFGKTKNKIYARKTIIKEVPTVEKRLFLNNNHIQGDVSSSINLGLYYNDNLVSLMCFTKPRINVGGKNIEGNYELVRFCSKINTNIIGGASKLLNTFIKQCNPNEIITYADRRWSVGNMYHQIGFDLINYSAPNYFYVIENHRENRFKYRKSELVKEGFDKNKSEHNIMLDRKIYRIYDCGTIVFKWQKDNKNDLLNEIKKVEN